MSSVAEPSGAQEEDYESEGEEQVVGQGDVPVWLTDFMALLVSKKKFSDVDFLVGPGLFVCYARECVCMISCT